MVSKETKAEFSNTPGRAAGTENEFLVNRRRFCNCLWLSSAMLVLDQAVAKPAVNGGVAVMDQPMRIEGAESLLPGSSLLFVYPTPHDPAILVRTRDHSYHAYCQKCSHLGCSIYFDTNLNRLECPCHQGAYDIKSGFVLGGPPRRPLDEIMLQVRAGQVWAVGRRSYQEPLIADYKKG